LQKAELFEVSENLWFSADTEGNKRMFSFFFMVEYNST